MSGTQRALPRLAGVSIVVVIVANALFFGLGLASVELSRQRLCERIGSAFARGDVLAEGWLQTDTERGADPYTDCAVLQILLYRGQPAPLNALSVSWLGTGVKDGKLVKICGMVQEVCRRPEEVEKDYRLYHQYWYGSRVIAGLLLGPLDLPAIRRIYTIVTYASLVAFALAAGLASRRLLGTLAPIVLVGLFFSGISVFGPTLGQSPAFLWAIVGPTLMLTTRNRASRTVGAVAIGCVAAFLDLLNAVPLHAVLLLVTVYFFEADRKGEEGTALKHAAIVLVAFAVGFASSVLAKQILAAAAFGWVDVTSAFIEQLKWRFGMGPQAPYGVEISLAAPFRRLWASLPMLTYGSPKLAKAVAATAVVGWVAAFAGTIAQGRRQAARRLFDWACSLMVVLLLAGWYLALTNHTQIHSWFMVRPLFVPLALGWSLFCRIVFDSLSGSRTSATQLRQC